MWLLVAPYTGLLRYLTTTFTLARLIHVEQLFLQHKHRAKLNYQDAITLKLNGLDANHPVQFIVRILRSMCHGALSNNPTFIQCTA